MQPNIPIMRTMVKATLMAGIIVAFAWPFLFWGKVNGPHIQQTNLRQAPFVFTPQYDPEW